VYSSGCSLSLFRKGQRQFLARSRVRSSCWDRRGGLRGSEQLQRRRRHGVSRVTARPSTLARTLMTTISPNAALRIPRCAISIVVDTARLTFGHALLSWLRGGSWSECDPKDRQEEPWTRRRTRPMPPSIMTDATSTCIVSGSDRNVVPPSATSAGMESCTIAAWVAGRPRSATYQMT